MGVKSNTIAPRIIRGIQYPRYVPTKPSNRTRSQLFNDELPPDTVFVNLTETIQYNEQTADMAMVILLSETIVYNDVAPDTTQSTQILIFKSPKRAERCGDGVNNLVFKSRRRA